MSGTVVLARSGSVRWPHRFLSLSRITINSKRQNSTKAREVHAKDSKDDQAAVLQYASEKAKRRKRVYIWGSALTGALGHDRLVRPRSGTQPRASHNKPYKTPFAEMYKVEDVACGYGFTIFSALEDKIKSSHLVFGTGINTDFQLGYQCARKGKAPANKVSNT